MVFIPIAEETELIHEITLYVFYKLQEFINFFDKHQISIHINLSTKDLYHNKIIQYLEVNNYKNLFLEITENSLINDFNSIIKNIKRLKRYNYKFCLDDFGTGFSSLMYLQELPIDLLKIDKLFIKDLTTSIYKQSIIKATLEICNNLNIGVIAEGIEDKKSKEFLENLNIFNMQGFYFAKPMPFKKIQNYILSKEYLEKL
ncbi:MAG: hypothetical protein KatS3mg129_1287 [Leptospiraceae bacterium]|nr:MAG: hypothetical protein KatS3mg129_1287 [Leptospiraceae bacterium]